MFRNAIVLTIFLLLATIARADQPRVFLITMGPGDEAWELFGHNALWIHDGDENPAYNWGVFDFGNDFKSQMNFFWRFLQGRMRYWMEPFDAYRTVDAYHSWNRSVRIQELNLTQQQIAQLKRELEINALPENKFYTYDYFRDNCTTRVRDAIDHVIGGAIANQLKGKPTGTTYRWHTRRLSQGSPWLYVCLYYILGEPTDRPIDEWQECFLPAKLSEHLKEVKLGDRPLIVPGSQRDFPAENRAEEPVAPRRAWPWFLAAGVLLAIVFVLTSRWRWVFAIFAMLWAILCGLAGMICTWGWLFTDHWAARLNENWLQLSPVSIVLVPLVFLCVLRDGSAGASPSTKRSARLRRAFILSAVVLGLSVFGLLMKILPMFRQVNYEIIALAIPAHLGLLLGIIKLKGRYEAHALRTAPGDTGDHRLQQPTRPTA